MKKFFLAAILFILLTITFPVFAQTPQPTPKLSGQLKKCYFPNQCLGTDEPTEFTCDYDTKEKCQAASTAAPAQPQNFLGTISNQSIPGLDCGVGGATDGTEKCCSLALPQINTLPAIPSGSVTDVLSKLPLTGDIINAYNSLSAAATQRLDAIKNFQKNNPNTVCVNGEPQPSATDPNCKCASSSANMNKSIAQLCYNYLSNTSELKDCLACASGDGMWTGIGCIPLNLQSFVGNFLLSMGIGFGGLVAILCIIYSAFMMQTSQGSPEKIKKSQEMLTSCIMGLMLIVFSIFILKLIGVNILRIPFL